MIRILFFVHGTLGQLHRTGVHRVVVELARALPKVAAVDFVRWDEIEGQLRYLTRSDLVRLFAPEDVPDHIQIHPLCQRVRYRFGDTLRPGNDVWLLMPEVSHHFAGGNEIYSRVLAQARDLRIKNAAVFYDLIPITNADYHDAKASHHQYVVQLARTELILPISQYSADVLAAHYEAAGVPSLRSRIHTLALPDGGHSPRADFIAGDESEKSVILMLGTLEPRKRQLEVMRVFDRNAEKLRNYELVAIGGLHHTVHQEIQSLIRKNERIHHSGYVSQAVLESWFRRTAFTVFASNDEGYGLPICESLVRGIPCLTANFGSMAEVAEGGGCLTVDVNNLEEIERGLLRLAFDAGLREQLCEQIRGRTFQTWHDYAIGIVSACEGYRDDFIAAPQQVAWISRTSEPTNITSSSGRPHLVFDAEIDDAKHLSTRMLEPIFSAASWTLPRGPLYATLLKAAADSKFDGLVPSRVTFADDSKQLKDVSDAAVAEATAFERRLKATAESEEHIQTLTEFWKYDLPAATIDLCIVISTYNRAAFATANARWILSLIEPFEGRVRLTVVDNDSEDETEESLQVFNTHPFFTFVRNPANTGMLGNLHRCSTLMMARHIWMVGDDDFIAPEALPRVLERIHQSPEIPLQILNFSVYHRQALRPGDSPSRLIAEGTPLARAPSESGFYRVNEIALEHDNFFTAMYAIVFRSDLLAACFNYPFDGKPFSSLTESVPTTKYILGVLGHVRAFWHAPIMIAGNAHNSWRTNRIPWHRDLMPQVFELAREAGIDDRGIMKWTQVHEDLLQEAVGLYSTSMMGDIRQSTHPAGCRVFRWHDLI